MYKSLLNINTEQTGEDVRLHWEFFHVHSFPHAVTEYVSVCVCIALALTTNKHAHLYRNS